VPELSLSQLAGLHVLTVQSMRHRGALSWQNVVREEAVDLARRVSLLDFNQLQRPVQIRLRRQSSRQTDC